MLQLQRLDSDDWTTKSAQDSSIQVDQLNNMDASIHMKKKACRIAFSACFIRNYNTKAVYTLIKYIS